MAFGKRNKAPTRDLGLSSNGKGDRDRTSNVSKFRDNFDRIEWEVVELDMERKGRKLVKRYGGPAPVTIEQCLSILK